ncbi:TlpA family protein disulfide reductase [Pedobacter sp. ASV12]|uniref:TlpA family protein disulfide reductase n=1 Tax=Pedobacter sp. ASV12 TaxID=2795120 RepID=UPI0018EB093B|nr:TlpA disulfide reductase family protein [Pedobacter sp. ASV12]
MKKTVALFFMIFALLAKVQAQTLKFSSLNPEIGKPISFEYHPKGGTLGQYSDIKCVAKAFTDIDNPKRIAVNLEKIGDSYKGTFTPTESTHLALLVFYVGETIDENPAGYFTKFYRNGTATPMSLLIEGYLYAGLGNRLVKLKTDNAKAFDRYEKAFQADRTLKEKYLNEYLVSQGLLNNAKANEMARQYIGIYAKRGNSEKNLNQMVSLYAFLKDKKAQDSVNKLIRTKYPLSTVALKFTLDSVFSLQADAYQKEAAFKKAIADFKLDLNKSADLAKIGGAINRMGIAFISTKNSQKVEEFIDMNPLKDTRAMFYNSFAAQSISTKKDLDFALGLSKKSLDLMEMVMQEEMPEYFKDYYYTQAGYLKVRRGFYESYKNTYAALLAAAGRDAEALAMVTVAVKENNYESVELNERYIDLLIKNGKSDQVKAYVEQFVKAGVSSAKLKENLKSVYQGATPFEAYYSGLEKEASTLEEAKLAKEMINMPAPVFTLTNLKGEKVSLASLKGKTVIVDFWATWCGPCLNSFPGMQLAINKYKDDPSVVFLFVNTWERDDEREKLVKDWFATKKYTFNILFDSKNKNNPNEFEVVEAYKVPGIPTKFVIDGKGNIRFKKVGAPETDEGIVRELDTMISLVKNSQ